MTGEAELSGYRILVVEDDYYLATDAARALTQAGGQVLGPFPNEGATLDGIEAEPPDAALVDINLGAGPSFVLAAHLQTLGIPFAFITGYDAGVIPAAFDGVERLEKPVPLGLIVRAASRLVRLPA